MKIGRNDPCWCGSGKKYKKCHYGREHSDPPTQEDLNRLLKKAFNKSYCLHPESKAGKCSGTIVKAHSIQRNGGLSKIAQNNHVYRIIPNSRSDSGEPRSIIDSIGLKKASTFTGFCEYHDTQTFKPIEQLPFTGLQNQIFLLAYRPLCKEAFLKRNQFDLSAELLRVVDKGYPVSEQQQIQEFWQTYHFNVSLGVRTFERQKANYDNALLQQDYSQLSHVTIFIDQCPEILCCGTSILETDFIGRCYNQLNNPEIWQQIINFSIIPTDSGGVISFATLDKGSVANLFIDSLRSLTAEQLPNAIVRFAFEYFENTFISPIWWNQLSEKLQKSLLRRMESGRGVVHMRDSNCLLDDNLSYVRWNITNITYD